MPKISIKNAQEIDSMKKGGKIAALVLDAVKKAIRPGITTRQLDQITEEIIAKHNAKPSFKGFGGYPAATCVSINDEVVHGIPSDRRLVEGDIVGIDVGVYYQGLHSDTAITVGVGKIKPEAQKLMDTTQESLMLAIAAIKPGVHLCQIQAIIQKTAEKANLGIVRELTGHGVGKNLQEDPSIPNYVTPEDDIILKEGYTLAIEPMFTTGGWRVKIQPDGWTIVTADKSLSAHFEHSIAITKTGAEVLTKK